MVNICGEQVCGTEASGTMLKKGAHTKMYSTIYDQFQSAIVYYISYVKSILAEQLHTVKIHSF